MTSSDRRADVLAQDITFFVFGSVQPVVVQMAEYADYTAIGFRVVLYHSSPWCYTIGCDQFLMF